MEIDPDTGLTATTAITRDMNSVPVILNNLTQLANCR
jgi:hypothetical protein